MNIDELIKESRVNSSEILSKYCIVNEKVLKLDVIENWGYQDFINYIQKGIPKKLYKYFPNKYDTDNFNYSIDALKENYVYLAFPKVFDDVFDSDISISFDQFKKYRLIEFCRRADIKVSENESFEKSSELLFNKLKEYKNYLNAFNYDKCSEIENMSNELFCKRLSLGGLNNDSLNKVMKAEYKYCLDELKNSFKTTCFATSPLSQLMWGGAYANKHKGFCIEYDISRDEKYRVVYENLFPLVYSKVRSNMEKEFINSIDSFPSIDDLKNIYLHGALRKSIDWAFQNEWRLLLVEGMPEMKDSKVDFFPITKVYIGCRMPVEERKKIIDICKSKGIEYVGVKKRQDIFEMEECKIEL